MQSVYIVQHLILIKKKGYVQLAAEAGWPKGYDRTTIVPQYNTIPRDRIISDTKYLVCTIVPQYKYTMVICVTLRINVALIPEHFMALTHMYWSDDSARITVTSDLASSEI